MGIHRIAVVLALAVACPAGEAFTAQTSLSSKRTACDITLHASSCDELDTRRAFIDASVRSLSAVALSPLVASAADDGEEVSKKPKLRPLRDCLYNVLRVREASEQETRLISTGKFKDSARQNVKLAVKFMINNYSLSDSIIAGSSYLKGNDRVDASGVGQSAVQSLLTIVEYFDASSVENIKVDSLEGKEKIVLEGLKSVRRDLDEFTNFFPKDDVDAVKARILTENELNFREFDTSLGQIINPNPSDKSAPAVQSSTAT